MDYQGGKEKLKDILDDAFFWLEDGFRGVAPSVPKPAPPPVLQVNSKESPAKPSESGSKSDLPTSGKNWNYLESGPKKSLEDVADVISHCRKCKLSLIRESTVPGTGSAHARLMVITQPPWEHSSFETSPLIAMEQDYLEKWVHSIGLDIQKDVFVTPAVKCPTPAMRPAAMDELSSCSDHLMQQINSVSPSALLALGSSACAALTSMHSDFANLVGKNWKWHGIPALILWRPAEVLANPGKLRRPVWESLKRLRRAWDALPESQL